MGECLRRECLLGCDSYCTRTVIAVKSPVGSFLKVPRLFYNLEYAARVECILYMLILPVPPVRLQRADPVLGSTYHSVILAIVF
jgi:hypothetical protein